MRIVFCIFALLVGLAGARAGDDRQKPLGDVPLMHEEAEAAGLHSVYDGPWEFFVGGGGAALDCDGSGFPSVFLAGGKNPAKLFVNKSKAGGPLQIRGEGARHRRRSETARPTSSAPIRSTSTATATWICSCSGSAAISCSRAAPTARSRSPTRNGISTAIPAGRPRSPPNGSRDRNSRRWRSAIMSTATRRARPGAPARTIRSIARKPATSPTIRCARRSRRASARCRCCSPTGTSRARRRCASPTTGNITAAAKSRCGASTRARRRGSTRAPTAGGICRSTAWASPKAISTARATREYFLTSMGDEKLQKLDPDEGGRGEAPVYRDIAGEVGATAHIPYAGGDKRPSTAWHAEFADFNNDGLLDIFVSKGNLEQMPDFAAYDPSNLLLGQWNGKFAEAGDEAGIACNAKGRGALIADFNLDGRLDILQINRGSNAPALPQSRRQERRRRRRCRWATGARSSSIEPNPNRNAVGARISIKTGTRSADALRRGRRRRRLGPRGLDPCRPRHGRARGNPGAMAGRRPEPVLSRVRQPVRGRRPHEAAGGILVPGAVERSRRRSLNDGSTQLAMTSFTCMIGSIFV